MSPTRTWPLVLRYAFGIIAALTALVNIDRGFGWCWAVIGVCAVTVLVFGERRIFRASAIRVGDELECRYIPWYESNGYLFLLVIPMIGLAAAVSGLGPESPGWFRYAGLLLLALTPAFALGIVSKWHRSLLRITPSALVIHAASDGRAPTDVARERITAIELKVDELGSAPFQIKITYRPSDVHGALPATVVLGKDLSVRPVSLFNALTAWRTGSDDLDRIAALLRVRWPQPGRIEMEVAKSAQSRSATLWISAIGVSFLVMAVVVVATGAPWYAGLPMASIAVLTILGFGRKFRPAVTRSAGEVVCRYLPWREGNAYGLVVALPALGLGAVLLSNERVGDGWGRFGGLFLLAVTPVLVFRVVQMWRCSLLRITPSALTLGVSASGSGTVQIRREDVAAITVAPVRVVSVVDLQVRIDYFATGDEDADDDGIVYGDDGTVHYEETETETGMRTVVIGPTPSSGEPALQLTVDTTNVGAALTLWRESGQADPVALLDEIESILRRDPYAAQLSNSA